MSNALHVRDALVEFLRRDLIGPAFGEYESIIEPPRIRYTAGILFPQDAKRNEDADEVDVGDEESAQDSSGDPAETSVEPAHEVDASRKSSNGALLDAEYDDQVVLANSHAPCALGMTFLVHGADAIVVTARAADYVRSLTHGGPDLDKPGRRAWTRNPLAIPPVRVDLAQGMHDLPLMDGLSLRVQVRTAHPSGVCVTVSLYNTSRIQHGARTRTFFQAGFRVEVEGRSDCIAEFDGRRPGVSESLEELGLALLYRKRTAYAIGHGCAVDWSQPAGGHTAWLETSIMPSVEVDPIVPTSKDQPCFDMFFLSGGTADRDEILAALNSHCKEYEAWIEERRSDIGAIPERFHQAARRNILLCDTAARRMRSGVEALERDRMAFRAFQLANHAMLMQQYHSRLRRKLDDDWIALPQADGYMSNWSDRRGYWRAFQLGFILQAIPGLSSDEASVVQSDGSTISERDLVDLIWFPTGGGKTEAYLGLTAFLIFLIRLRDPASSGCKVLMRYTLRLLTTQQFQRASSLVCACEVLRRADVARLGEVPISIGLWVGQSLTPNDEDDALKKLALLQRPKSQVSNPFQLLACPWCGTPLDNPRKLGYAEYKRRQVFVCPAESCPFGRLGAHLPVCVVDQSLYEQPATLIIGTVDKFAMLAWRDAAGRLLTHGGGPELIIQDELHLISGPLGSMVGLYESVIEFLCSRTGTRPKIVASTATIKRAAEQCRALFDRDVLVYPPTGLDISDSYYATEDAAQAGRRYVGYFPSAAGSAESAHVRIAAATFQGLSQAAGDTTSDQAIDPYWTLVQYFGSLRELGRAATFLTSNIPEYLLTLCARYQVKSDQRRNLRRWIELTSRRDEGEIPQLLRDLEQSYERGRYPEDQALDTVLATSMISVGVDIDRLGLMLVVAQPKGTSEYIQATSRVGRSQAAPGLVLTLYSAGRPRDRSHYEQFRGYHEAFYRFVEPTSATPFSPPALDRALRAIMVIAGRHVAHWPSPADFEESNEGFGKFIEFLRQRVRRVDPEHLQDLDERLSLYIAEWKERTEGKWSDLGGKGGETALLRPASLRAAGSTDDSWFAPTSMRHVDAECGVAVIPRYRGMGATR